MEPHEENAITPILQVWKLRLDSLLQMAEADLKPSLPHTTGYAFLPAADSQSYYLLSTCYLPGTRLCESTVLRGGSQIMKLEVGFVTSRGAQS